MQPGDLAALVVPSDPRLHPDGVRAVFVVSRPDLEEDRYDRRIWLWDGSETRPLTRGPADSAPRWSPDGSHLAFLRKGPGSEDRPQVAILRVDGGEAEVVTDFELGVTALEWSPDGSRLAVVATTWTADWTDLDPKERSRRPRRITRLPARWDDRGWIHDRRSHVYLVDPAGHDGPVCLTPGDFDESGVAWRPDGAAVAFLSARHPERGLDPGTAVWEVAVEGGEVRRLAETGGWIWVGYDAGGTPHVVGTADRWEHPAVNPLQRIGPDGPVPVTGDLDRNLIPPAPPTAPTGPRSLSGGGWWSTVEDRGTVRVIEIAPDGSVQDMLGGDRMITGVDPAPDGGAAVFVATSPTDPGEVHVWDGHSERSVTRLNYEFREATPLIEPEHFTVELDGADLDVWVLLPDGDEPVPVLLNIHGGPATQYGFGFFDEFQLYAGAGYGVVGANPRGSSGAGNEHVRAVVGRWADPRPVDLEDLLAVLDAALERHPRLDPDRVGVMGGSYGGLMTVWLLAAEGDRFRSAVTERGLYSWISFSGTSDIGPWFDRLYLQTSLPEGWDTMWAAGPLSVAHRITTPTLVIHSEKDYRTPIDQGEQLFMLLHRLGVESEMLRFPDEGHELSRSGSPRHRVERFEAILDWHSRYLRDADG